MTIGNISNNIRFAPGYQCAQLIALIPIISGNRPTLYIAASSGIETHHETEEFRGWSRSVVHAVIRDVMTPIESVMKNGIRMACADGAEGLCFPGPGDGSNRSATMVIDLSCAASLHEMSVPWVSRCE